MDKESKNNDLCQTCKRNLTNFSLPLEELLYLIVKFLMKNIDYLQKWIKSHFLV